MKILLLLCLAVTTFAKPFLEDSGPEYGEFFEGDIIWEEGIDEMSDGYSVIADKSRVWLNGVMPYEIYNDYNSNELAAIQEAMNDISGKTCIRFVPRTSEHNDYVYLTKSGTGCNSPIGRSGGAQRISLDGGCIVHGIIMHEFMHSLGFFHEHNRADRDGYVRITWDNINPQYQYAFYKKVEGVEIDHLGTGYDYDSVMHYGRTAFSINGQETVTPTADPNAIIGQRTHISALDVQRMNILYQCGKKN